MFDIQNEIAREIVTALMPKLGLSKDANLVRQGTTSLEAYNLWLKALQWQFSPDPTTVAALVVGLRVAEDEERQGLDTVSHGERAYN